MNAETLLRAIENGAMNESITALSNGLQAYPGNLLFSVHDHQFIDEVANRIIEFPLDKGGVLDYEGSYDDFVQWKKERE